MGLRLDVCIVKSSQNRINRQREVVKRESYSRALEVLVYPYEILLTRSLSAEDLN